MKGKKVRRVVDPLIVIESVVEINIERSCKNRFHNGLMSYKHYRNMGINYIIIFNQDITFSHKDI